MGGGRAAAPRDFWPRPGRIGAAARARCLSHVVPEPGCPAPGAQRWKVRPLRFGSSSDLTPGQCVRGGNCKSSQGRD